MDGTIEYMKSVEEVDVVGKRVIVRCDFDVPVENGEILDDTRIKDSLPTLKYLLSNGAKLFLISKLGRPKGKDPNLSLEIIIDSLSKYLDKKIIFQKDLNEKNSDEIILLENLRFWSEEEYGDENFGKKLATFGDLYVNECFATSHRNDASIAQLPKILPFYAGLRLLKEVEELKIVMKNPARPLVAIIGGAKLETKLHAIFNLAKIADKVLVGGKLMFEVEIRSLPENVVVAFDDVQTKDIGEESVKLFSKSISGAKMVVWNGPMGVIEDSKYMKGTEEIAKAVIDSDAYSVIGGGDTILALNKLDLISKIKFVSSGGGAMLEFLAGKTLPGLQALGFYD